MIVKAPNFVPWATGAPTIFLAGSIEMGRAENWQDRVSKELDHLYTVLNPRRDDWDPSWEQSKDSPKFLEQVTWELTGLESANYVLMYFDKDTMSPVSLMELGIYAGAYNFGDFDPNMVVVCPDGFWRKGNVDIVCERCGLTQLPTLDAAIEHFKELANEQ